MFSKEDFTEILQESFKGVGLETSKEKGWVIFKTCMDAVVSGCLKDKENTISLGGVGKFEIIKAAPRLTKVGVVDFVPKLRFRPSSKIDERLMAEMGQTPDPGKMKARREALEKEGKVVSNLPPRKKAEEKAEAAPAAPAAPKAAPKAAPAASAKKGVAKLAKEIDDDFS